MPIIDSTCSGTTSVAKVSPVTGGTRQTVEHAYYNVDATDNVSSGDTKSQCQTVRIGPDGLQN